MKKSASAREFIRSLALFVVLVVLVVAYATLVLAMVLYW